MIAAALLLLGAADAEPKPLTVAQVETRHRQLVGKTIQVEGRLAECQPLSCGLLDDGTTSGVVQWLSFETAPKFDLDAKPYIGRRVIVEGTVLNAWWPGDRDASGVIAPPCFDRCPQFEALRIVRVVDPNEG